MAPWVLLHNPKRTEPGWGCGEGFVSSPDGFIGLPFVALLGAASSAPVWLTCWPWVRKGASPKQTEGRGCRHSSGSTVPPCCSSAQPRLTDLTPHLRPAAAGKAPGWLRGTAGSMRTGHRRVRCQVSLPSPRPPGPSCQLGVPATAQIQRSLCPHRGTKPGREQGLGVAALPGNAVPRAHPWAPDASWCGTRGRTWAETQTGARGSPEERATCPGWSRRQREASAGSSESLSLLRPPNQQPAC